MKQKITTRLLATLLLAVGSLAAIPLTTVLTGCTEEELFKTPPAEIANPELKPGEIAIHLNVPPLTGFGEAGTRAVGTGTGDHNPGKTSWAVGDELMVELWIQGNGSDYIYDIFTTATCTDAGNGGTTAKWQLSTTPQEIYRSAESEQNGAFVLMPSTFNPFGEQGRFILPTDLERCADISIFTKPYYAPGTRWVTELSSADLSLPTAATTGTLERWSLRDKLSNSINNLKPIGAADTAEEAARKRAANATKLATLFTFDLSKDSDGGNTNAFETQCGRLRIATFPGAKVQIASNCFGPAAKRTTYDATLGKFVAQDVTEADGKTLAVTVGADATYLDLDGKSVIAVGLTSDSGNGPTAIIPTGLPVYTTTADALGNAYFYGLIGTKNSDGSVSSSPIDGTNAKEFIVSVSLPATGSADGSAADKGAKQVIFRATKKAMVKLASGGSVKIDGNTVLGDKQKSYAVDVKDCTNAADLTSKLVAAHAAGQTVWTVTGKAGDKWSGGTNTVDSDVDITTAIKAALNTIYDSYPDARISLYLPTVTSIPAQAFEIAQNSKAGLLLQSITAPEATGDIGEYAFYGCSALTVAHLPKVTGKIGDNAFDGCTALTTISLPEATGIGDVAFYGCSALTVMNLPKVTGKIGGYAFQMCSRLTAISLPAATTIGGSAFSGCDTLTTAHLPAATSIGSYAFQGCAALTTAHLPAATSIGLQAFSGCEALTTAHLPAATSIGSYAFDGCVALTTLRFGTNPITTCGNTILGYMSESDTQEITLTLAPGQKNFMKNGTATDTPVQFGTGKSFAGYKFKEIKQAK